MLDNKVQDAYKNLPNNGLAKGYACAVLVLCVFAQREMNERTKDIDFKERKNEHDVIYGHVIQGRVIG